MGHDARLGIDHTVLSKRYLRALVEEKYVDGRVWIACDEPLREGNFVMVHIDGSAEGELTGYVID